ncbi:hypothetical protein HK101_000726, partial [Irineochytrium annulatum]
MLSRLLVADAEVVTIYFDFKSGSKMFVTSNHSDKLEPIQRQLLGILEKARRLGDMLANNAQVDLSNWTMDLDRFVRDYSIKKMKKKVQKVVKLANGLLMTQNGISLPFLSHLKEDAESNKFMSASIVVANFLMTELSDFVKTLDARLYRHLQKLADYSRFSSALKKLCRIEKYCHLLAALPGLVIFSKSAAKTIQPLDWNATVSYFAKDIGVDESVAETYRSKSSKLLE